MERVKRFIRIIWDDTDKWELAKYSLLAVGVLSFLGVALFDSVTCAIIFLCSITLAFAAVVVMTFYYILASSGAVDYFVDKWRESACQE